VLDLKTNNWFLIISMELCLLDPKICFPPTDFTRSRRRFVFSLSMMSDSSPPCTQYMKKNIRRQRLCMSPSLMDPSISGVPYDKRSSRSCNLHLDSDSTSHRSAWDEFLGHPVMIFFLVTKVEITMTSTM
jgi:hypothetical protein